MDPRREVVAIYKHFNRYHDNIGEAMLYHLFDVDRSEYDEVYDEGFRRYGRGIRIPILWIDQMEAVEDYAPEGRRPTQRMRCAVSARNMYEAGVSVTEVHGNQLSDTSPSDVWRRDRMHDIFWYDNRYWEVSGFQIRGRVKGEDVIIGVTGIETFVSDDMILDVLPIVVIPVTLIESPKTSGLYKARPQPVESPADSGLLMPIDNNMVEDPPGSGLYYHPALGGP